LEFDFGDRGVCIDEFTWYQQNSDTHGTWQVQGWDGSSWVDIGSSFTLGGSATQVITAPSGNTTRYTKYCFLGVSGTASSSPWLYQIDFQIDEGLEDGDTKYSNPGGFGDRTDALVGTVGPDTSTTSYWGSADGNNAIDGALNTGPYLRGPDPAIPVGAFIRWDLNGYAVIDEAMLWFRGGNVDTTTFGDWQWQGSNDASAWTDIGDPFVLINNTWDSFYFDGYRAHVLRASELHGNTTPYRYYQLVNLTETEVTDDGVFNEVDFRIGALTPLSRERVQIFMM